MMQHLWVKFSKTDVVFAAMQLTAFQERWTIRLSAISCEESHVALGACGRHTWQEVQVVKSLVYRLSPARF